MLKIKKENFINEKRPHDSGEKHVSGRALYIDDISEPAGTLYGAIGWSKKAHAIIKKINLNEVINSEGVIAVVTSEDINISALNLVSIFLSFIFSLITINYFIKYIKEFSLNIFVIYRVLLGIVLLGLAYL